MPRSLITVRIACLLPLMTVGCGAGDAPTPDVSSIQSAQKVDKIEFPNGEGFSRSVSTNVKVDLLKAKTLEHPFFSASSGTNGRACGTCHQADQGWSIRPDKLSERFSATQGLDPVFRLVDGANSPTAPVATEQQRRSSYSMLLSRGLIRVGIGIKNSAEFELQAVNDPYGYASAAELSLFRRPLPATNLAGVTSVMWDGRESFNGLSVVGALLNQANDATLGHAQANAALSSADRQAIVELETGLFTAQVISNDAGDLTTGGSTAGPEGLANQTISAKMNDPFGNSFNRNVFTLFSDWQNGSKKNKDGLDEVRKAIYRGQTIFNTKTFTISGVRGLNDVKGVPAIVGTCSTCHNTPTYGSNSLALAIDLGVTTDETLFTSDLPVYTLRNKSTGATLRTTDPGLALVSGKWDDIGKFKVPVLRSIEARSPYFHNGMFDSFEVLAGFYDRRFHIGFTTQEVHDLAIFLESL